MIDFDKLTNKETEIVHEFYKWAKGVTTSNFSPMLFRLICKADKGNQTKLTQGFPFEVTLVRDYQRVDGWWEEFSTLYKNKFMKDQKK